MYSYNSNMFIVIIGFMFGSLPVSLFYNIFGASLVRNKVDLEKFKMATKLLKDKSIEWEIEP